jgi:hypothetical protein
MWKEKRDSERCFTGQESDCALMAGGGAVLAVTGARERGNEGKRERGIAVEDGCLANGGLGRKTGEGEQRR